MSWDESILFERLEEFVAIYLVFASDFLVRAGELDQAVFEHYLSKLRSFAPALADAYAETAFHGHDHHEAAHAMAASRQAAAARGTLGRAGP